MPANCKKSLSKTYAINQNQREGKALSRVNLDSYWESEKMKRRILSVAFLLALLFLSTSLAMAGKPPAGKPSKASLDVTILSPVDGLTIEQGETFEVVAAVLAKNGDAGQVDSYVQYAVEGSTAFTNAGDDTELYILEGFEQPQTQVLANGVSYQVSWVLGGNPGTYEVRVSSQAATAKSDSSQSCTITINGPPPPPGIETIDDEYKDPDAAFGVSVGTYQNTYNRDGVYEVLKEATNSQGTKNPTDDTADLNWIYVFSNLDTSRNDTTFCLYGHMERSGEYLDSGFLEWDDQDTAFYVQEKSSGEWKTIAAITNMGADKPYCVDVPDDDSSTVYLRIVDNDRGYERKSPQVSSLYVDQAYIVYEPAFEYIIDDISFIVPTDRDCLRIADIDNDGWNDVYFTFQDNENGAIKYYSYSNGRWIEKTLPGINALCMLQVEDLDNDGINEILTDEYINGEAVLGYYKYIDGIWTSYTKIATLPLAACAFIVGNIDDDSENEVLVSKDPCDGFEIKYYDYNSEFDNWTEVGLVTWSYYAAGFGMADIDNDLDGYSEIFWLGISTDHPGNSALKYFKYNGNEWVIHEILNVDNGECMDIGDVGNDGHIEIAIGHYAYPERENQVRIYEYSDGIWSEHVVAYLSEALGPISDITIADIDNDDANEIAIGLWDDGVGLDNGSIRYYELDETTGEWTEYIVADPDMTIAVLQIGDLDNDGENEVLVGLTTTYSYSVVAPELRYYKLQWKPE
jgi:hypothetical protein